MPSPTETTDFYNGFIDNIFIVLNIYKSFLGFEKLIKTDDAYISVFPTIAIELDNATEVWKSSPRQKTITATYLITWYYRQYDETVLRTNVRSGLNNIMNVLRENWNLNGYTPDLGSTPISADPYFIAQGEEIIAGGLISLVCNKVMTVSIVASP